MGEAKYKFSQITHNWRISAGFLSPNISCNETCIDECIRTYIIEQWVVHW